MKNNKNDNFKKMTHVIFIVDNSSSTRQYIENYVNAVNGIIFELKRVQPSALLTLATFNQHHKYLCFRKSVSTIEQGITTEEFDPQGMTSLYHNIIVILNKIARFESTIDYTSNSICIILTDGQDTYSKFNEKKLAALQIEMMKTTGCKFVYLSLSHQGMELGKSLGCNMNILYKPREKSLNRVVNTISELFRTNTVKDTDIDLRDLEQSFSSMELG